MNIVSLARMNVLRRFYATATSTSNVATPLAGKAKKKFGKMGAPVEKVVLPVETDAKKLVKYVCGSNISREGGEDIEVKPDSEYPSWLWELNTGKPKPLEELDPNTKEYWYRVRKQHMIKNNRLSKLKKF